MEKAKAKYEQRAKRHYRVRHSVSGTLERPRLSIFRSHKNICCQLIDDIAGTTLLAVSTLTPDIKKAIKSGGNVEAAKILGQRLAEKALAQKIDKIALDRGAFPYHGRIKALAEAARAGGLKF
jgi:large subunit ribosomal protein L18